MVKGADDAALYVLSPLRSMVTGIAVIFPIECKIYDQTGKLTSARHAGGRPPPMAHRSL